jgi:hypothetical protein
MLKTDNCKGGTSEAHECIGKCSRRLDAVKRYPTVQVYVNSHCDPTGTMQSLILSITDSSSIHINKLLVDNAQGFNRLEPDELEDWQSQPPS